MSSEYAVQKASPSVDPGIVQFFESFYAISDDPSELERYVDQFTHDAVFVIGGTEPTRGADEIRKWREHEFDYMKYCKHIPHKIFSLEPGSTEVMLHGHVLIGHHNLRESSGNFAVRAILKQTHDNKWQLEYYEAFLDVGALAKAGAP